MAGRPLVPSSTNGVSGELPFSPTYTFTPPTLCICIYIREKQVFQARHCASKNPCTRVYRKYYWIINIYAVLYVFMAQRYSAPPRGVSSLSLCFFFLLTVNYSSHIESWWSERERPNEIFQLVKFAIFSRRMQFFGLEFANIANSSCGNKAVRRLPLQKKKKRKLEKLHNWVTRR